MFSYVCMFLFCIFLMLNITIAHDGYKEKILEVDIKISLNDIVNERSVFDKVVLVTGASQGIGYTIAENFLKNGAKNVILLDIFGKQKKGKMAENILNHKYGKNKAEFIECDVTSDLDDVFDIIIEKYQKVDVLINNAGIANEKKPHEIMLTNAVSTAEWTLKFFQYMRRDNFGKGGTIINISSMTARNIDPVYPTYRATKLAILGFSMAQGHLFNYKRTGVRIITLCPGPTTTSMAYESYCQYDEDLLEKIVKYFNYVFQSPDDVGRGAVVLFKTADSGTTWDVKDGKMPIKSDNTLNIFPYTDIYAVEHTEL